MAGYYRHSTAGDQLASSLLSGAILLLVAMTLLTAYLVVRAVNLLLTAFAHHPKHPALWILLLSSLGLWTATGIVVVSASSPMGVQAHQQLLLLASIVGALALVATMSLLVIARVLEIMQSDLLMLDQGKTTLVDKVLRQPWWNGSD